MAIPLNQLASEVADLLDQVMQRRENSSLVSRRLITLAAEQEAQDGGPEPASLLARAQGLVGLVTVSPLGDPFAEKAIKDLIAFKRELRALARS